MQGAWLTTMQCEPCLRLKRKHCAVGFLSKQKEQCRQALH